jgi:hypothetical protein
VSVVSAASLPRRPGVGPLQGHDDTPLLLPEETPPGRFRAAELVAEWVLFTHVLFFTHGHLLHDPVEEFVNARNLPSDSVGWLSLPLDILVELPDRHHGHLLFVASREIWPDLFHFLGQVSGISRQRSRYWRAMCQHLEILDPLGLAEPSGPVKVPLYVFGVDASDGIWCVEPNDRKTPLWLRVKRLPPEKATLRLARAALGNSSDPYQYPDQEF